MRTKKSYVRISFLFVFLPTINLLSQNTGTITSVPTFQSISLTWSNSGGSANIVCNVKYRVAGSGAAWLDGYPLWFDTRAHNANDVPGYSGVVLPANQYRGSIVGLTAGTSYEVLLNAGSATATTTITTWAETSAWPIGNTTTVNNTSSQLNITASGTANGYNLYTGSGVIDVANGATHCIYINAAYIIIRGLTLKGASEDAIRLGPLAHDVVIENCDISGWGATTFPTGYTSFPNTHSGIRIRGKAENDAGSTENCYNVTRIVVQRNKIHDPRGTASSWDYGYPYGPQGIAFQEAGGNMVIRYNDIYGSEDHHFQDGIGGLNNFTKSGFPRENSDIYGNKISYCWDDGIESEGADCNVRIYENFLDNVFIGVADATNSVGPLYVFRNVTYVGRRHAMGTSNNNLDVEDRGPFNKCGTQNSAAMGGRSYFFHNTVLQPTQTGFSNPRGMNGGIMDNGGGPFQNTISRNNIWTAAYQGQGGKSVAENNNGSGVGCTYQYDVCNTSLVLRAGVASNILNGNPTYAAGVPVAPLAVNQGPRSQGYNLAANSIGYDDGVVLPNFNDGYAGAAPDAGAYEAGNPLLEFGINAHLPAPGGNASPSANAGIDITMTLPINSTVLSGTGSDPDGTIVSYAWSRVSGPTTYTFGSANLASTSLTNLVQGVYVFNLTVTDNGGATASDEITVTVNAAINQPPTANAGSDITLTLPTNSTSLNGSGSDPDGTIASYTWERVSGPTTYTLGNPNSATTTLSNLLQGVYIFRLTVTDNNGATATDNVTVMVNPAGNIAPIVNAGTDITLTLPVNSVTLNGSATDPDGTITSYFWSKVNGPSTYTIINPNVATTVLSSLVQGIYTFRLTVTDNSGAVSTDDIMITVYNPANQPPVAKAGNDIAITLPANSTTLNGNSSFDPDGMIVSYQWNRISGPNSFILTSAGTAATGLYNLVQGVYVFRLTVTDNSGSTGTDDITITVGPAVNQVPVANAGNDIVITLPVNSTVLIGSGTDNDGIIVGYSWTRLSGPATYTFGNANAASTTLTNLVQGVYVFRLTVTDNSGATGTDNVTVVVNAANPPSNQPPTVNAGNDITLTLPINSTTLNGSGTDPDGTIVSYNWTKVSGPAMFLVTNGSSATTALSNLVQGVYVFRLTVIDNYGATASDNVTVTVNAAPQGPNQPPVARTTFDSIILTLPINSTTLSGTPSTDPDGTIATYDWTQQSGPSQATISNTTSANVQVMNLVIGVYYFTLKVTDNDGATNTKTIKVIVKNKDDANIYFIIYPNPTSGPLTLKYINNDNGKVRLSVYDAVRRLVRDAIVDKTQAAMTELLDVSNLLNGVYIIQLESPDGIRVAAPFIKF